MKSLVVSIVQLLSQSMHFEVTVHAMSDGTMQLGGAVWRRVMPSHHDSFICAR